MIHRVAHLILAIAVIMPVAAKVNKSARFLQVRGDAKPLVKSGDIAELTLVDTTTGSGSKAKCLDGTAPGYYWRPGAGNDGDKVVIFLEGGGWCFPSNPQFDHSCAYRAEYLPLGSSKDWDTYWKTDWDGFLSGDPEKTKWADWAVAFVKYCDGGSWLGTREEPFSDGSVDVYFRGHYNLIAVLDSLVATKNVSTFKQVVLGGSSAGGMACILKCDYVAEYFANYSIPVKCICDAGIFLDIDTVTGAGNVMQTRFHDIANVMESQPGLPRACVEGEIGAERVWQQCVFPQHVLKYLTTPTFVINSLYNFGSWEMLTAPYESSFPPDREDGVADDWKYCWGGTFKLTNESFQACNSTQKNIIASFRDSFVDAIEVASSSDTPHGVFADACPHLHMQVGDGGDTSGSWNAVKVNNTSIAEASARWYFDGSQEKHVDGYFPNNPTCGEGF